MGNTKNCIHYRKQYLLCRYKDAIFTENPRIICVSCKVVINLEMPAGIRIPMVYIKHKKFSDEILQTLVTCLLHCACYTLTWHTLSAKYGYIKACTPKFRQPYQRLMGSTKGALCKNDFFKLNFFSYFPNLPN